MATLVNNQETTISTGGTYALKASGALDLQWELDAEGFNTISGGSFGAVADAVVDLPSCKIKVINAGANSLVIKRIRS